MKGFLVFLLIVSIVINVVLIGEKYFNYPKHDDSINNEQTIDIEQLRKLAKKFGMKEINSYTANDLLNEIIILSQNGEVYNGDNLSDEEIKKIEGLLYGKDSIIQTIKNQDNFLRKINGKEILILN